MRRISGKTDEKKAQYQVSASGQGIPEKMRIKELRLYQKRRVNRRKVKILLKEMHGGFLA